MPTLREVAAVAGVDVSTASRVLNNDPRLVVRPTTRARVEAAASYLKYKPNPVARALRGGRTHTLAMLIPDVKNVVYAAMIDGAEERAAKGGYVLVVGATASRHQSELYLGYLSARLVDAVILASSFPGDPLLEWVTQSDLPFVLVNRQVEGVRGSVTLPDEKAAALVVRHFTELGHEAIGHVAGAANVDTAARRKRGFQRALAELGLPRREEWIIDAGYGEEDGRKGMNRLLDLARPPTAVFAANILAALGAMRAARDRGLAIPRDVSVTGFHDHAFAAHTAPPLTTVWMPLAELGATAVEAALRRIAGGSAEDIVVDVAPKMIIRASTAPPKGG